MVEKKRDLRIDALYAIGTLLVLIGHSHSSDWSVFRGTVLEQIINFIYVFHMPLFYTIGGLLFQRSNRIERDGYRKWICEKTLKLLTPYIILSLLAAIPKYYFEKKTLSGIGKLVFETIFAPRLGVWGHFWFLPVLFLLYAAFGMIRQLFKRKFTTCENIIIIMLSVILFFMPHETVWLGFSDFKTAVFYFAVGITVECLTAKKNQLSSRIYKLGWILIGTAISIIIFRYIKNTEVVKLILSIIMITVCWQLADLICNCSAVQWLGQHNYTVYIYSWLFQSIAMIVCDYKHLPWQGTLIVMFCVGLVFRIILIKFYEKLTFLHCRFCDLMIGMK